MVPETTIDSSLLTLLYCGNSEGNNTQVPMEIFSARNGGKEWF
jgi:hypothetical protein